MTPNLDKSAWERVVFGDVVANVNDYYTPDLDGVLPYVAGPHINAGEPTVARYGSTDDDQFPPTFKRKFHPGDVLLHSRGIEKLASVDRLGVTGEKLFVLRTKDERTIAQEFLVWLLRSPEAQTHIRDNFTGSVNKFINWKPLAAFEFDLPALDKQKRTADLLWVLERHRRSVATTTARARDVDARALEDVSQAGWPFKTVAELGDVQLGQQLHPKYRSGPKIRQYLRVANVFDDELNLSDVATMDFSDAGTERFRLRRGDILLNEGQSIELVGRCAMFRDEIEDCYMQKTLLRFRSGSDILPDFALAWFRRCYLMGEFSALAKRTTSMAHLTAIRFSAMPMPCPPLDVQRDLVARSGSVKAATEALRAELARLDSLRSSLIVATFGGK